MPIKGQSPKEVVHTEMHKFKHGSLHSGSKHGPLVRSRKQAIAIALSESGQSNKALRIAKRQAKKYADGGDVGLSDADQAAMSPETYVNPMAKNLIGNTASTLYNIPKNMVEGSEENAANYAQNGMTANSISPKSIQGGGDLIVQGLQNAITGSGAPSRSTFASGPAAGSGLGSMAFKSYAQKAANNFAKDTDRVFYNYNTALDQKPLAPSKPLYVDPTPKPGLSLSWQPSDTDKAMAAIEKALNESTPESFGKFSEPIQSESHSNLGGFPNVVPFQSPYKAMSQGYVTPAVHGTRIPEGQWQTLAEGKIGEPGDALRLPGDELGVHFGTPDQAKEFTGSWLSQEAQPRTYPVVLQTGKSLELPDMGLWKVDHIKEALQGLNKGVGYGIDHGVYKVADSLANKGEFPSSELNKINSIEGMRTYLHSKGYDSVNYINKVEGPGQRSYIMFKPGSDQNFVSGVRSPFAKFDQSQMHRPDLAAGIAGTIGAAGAGAAAMSPQDDQGRASGGKVGNFDPERGAAIGLARQGMIQSEVPGRTDKLNLNVPTGSYIIPSDIVSGLGQGNSMAGNSILNKMFNSGPYGMSLPRTKSGMRVGNRHSSLSMNMHMAKGGRAIAPIVAAGGEYVVHPDSVAHLGGGNMDTGHSILDAFVKHVRDKHIKTLKKLKPPKGSK